MTERAADLAVASAPVSRGWRGSRTVANWTKLSAIFRITVASRTTYLGEMLVRTTFLLIILFTFAQLWRATNASQNVTVATGCTIPQLIWYLVFTEAFVMSAPLMGDNEVDREVRTGDIAYRLTRPLSYPLYHLAAGLGERVLQFSLYLGVGSAMAVIIVGPIPLAPLPVASALGTVMVAMVADWVWVFTISLFSFWIEDTLGLHLLYRRLLMLLGGMLMPLDALPAWLARIAYALPFQYLVYRPARLFIQGDLSGLFPLLGAQLLFLGAGLVPLLAVYHLGLRRVSAQGG